MIAEILQDVRYALRILRKHPGFTFVAVLTLALGIGANAAIFSLTDAVLLQSLPVKDPSELTAIAQYDPRGDVDSVLNCSYPMYQDLRDKNDVFTGVLARGGAQMNVSFDGHNDRVQGELVSGNYFDVLGVNPWIGRFFTPAEDRTPAASPVAVLSYGFWARRFGKDVNIVGKTILINEHPLTVLGVTPPEFHGLDLTRSPDVLVPLMMTPVFNPFPPTRLQSRDFDWLTLMARRKDGVSLEQAQASLALLYQHIREGEAQQLSADMRATERQRFLAVGIQLRPGGQGLQRLQREMRRPLLLLFGATFFVLLILCANLANLVLVRDAVRNHEVAVRLALGAGRLRLLRQWLTEAILLALLGALAGVLVATWVRSALVAFMPPDYQTNFDTSMGWRFAGFILLVSLIVGMAFGLAPALRAARSSSALALRGESRNLVSGGGLFSLRSGLILVQVALSVPLLIISVLFLTSLHKLRGLDTGFGKSNVLIASINPSLNGYSPGKTQRFYRDLLLALRTMPGVQSASLSSDSPISGGWNELGVVVESYQKTEGERMDAQSSLVSSDYFRSLGISLVAGRDFTERDTSEAPKVAIINQKMAHYFFGDKNPLGRKIGTDKEPDTVIVGVVKDAQYLSLREPALKHFYEPIMQQRLLFGLTMHLKTTGDPSSIVDLVRAQVKILDPHLPLYGVTTLADQIDESLTKERLVTWLCTAFGLLATLLATVGLYGALAFSVTQRTREIGIRVALGAQARDVFKLIIGHGMLLIAMGVVLGLGASFALTKLITSLLFGVSPTNAATFIVVAAGLALVALLACYVPARRATKVDPLVALRYE